MNDDDSSHVANQYLSVLRHEEQLNNYVRHTENIHIILDLQKGRWLNVMRIQRSMKWNLLLRWKFNVILWTLPSLSCLEYIFFNEILSAEPYQKWVYLSVLLLLFIRLRLWWWPKDIRETFHAVPDNVLARQTLSSSCDHPTDEISNSSSSSSSVESSKSNWAIDKQTNKSPLNTRCMHAERFNTLQNAISKNL